MEEQNNFKETGLEGLMLNRSFYLYKLKYPTTFTLPDLSVKFAMDKVIQNVKEINVSEDEKRKHLLVIEKKEGNYLYGHFYKAKQESQINIIDEGEGTVTIEELDQNQSWAEKSKLIIDLSNNFIFGEYNYDGVRFFQSPFGEYLRETLGRSDIDIEIVYNKESYENLANRDIKYFQMKVTKPKLKIMEDVFGMSNLDVFNEADESQSLTINLKVTAGRNKSFSKSFIERVLGKFNAIIDKKGIRKFEVKQTNFDIPLELVKTQILRTKIDIQDKTNEEVFTLIVQTYEELELDEFLEVDDND